MNSHIVKLVLFGPPGAGKGTIAAQLIDDVAEGAYLATGDYFRRLIREGDPRSSTFSSYMDAGKLIPDEIVIGEVDALWADGRFDGGFVFDGFPRTIGQAHALESKMIERNLGELTAVAYIDVPDTEVLKRLTTRRVCPSCDAIYNTLTMRPKVGDICDRCGHQIVQRPDDTEATISNRLSVYKSQTADILEYYRNKDLLLELDGMIGSDQVLERIQQAL